MRTAPSPPKAIAVIASVGVRSTTRPRHARKAPFHRKKLALERRVACVSRLGRHQGQQPALSLGQFVAVVVAGE